MELSLLKLNATRPNCTRAPSTHQERPSHVRRSCSQAVEIPAGHTLNFRSSFVLLSGLLLHRRPADVGMNGGHPQTCLVGTPGIHNAPTDQSASYSSLSRLKVHQTIRASGQVDSALLSMRPLSYFETKEVPILYFSCSRSQYRQNVSVQAQSGHTAVYWSHWKHFAQLLTMPATKLWPLWSAARLSVQHGAGRNQALAVCIF